MEQVKSRAMIERALIKKFRKPLWAKFIKAIKEYELIQDGDRIAVAISGGKDSLLLAKLFQELSKHGHRNFEAVYIAMDPGYAPDVLEGHKRNLAHLGIDATLYPSNIFEVTDEVAGGHPCYLCARMRRGNLYAKAQELGCNKLALGHHFDDVIETILMNILASGCYNTMMPKLHSDHFDGMEIIRPLYLVREDDIRAWVRYAGFEPLDCACRVTKKKEGSMRFRIKALIRELQDRGFKNVEMSIFRSAQNVELGRVIQYKKDGRYHHFLDEYDQNGGSEGLSQGEED